MDLEELKKALEGEEGKTYLTGLISQATDGITMKNTELLTEVKKLRKGAESVLDDKDLKELKRKAKELDEIENKNLESKGEYETLIAKTREQHTEEITKKDSKISELETRIKGFLVDGGLTKALTEINCNPALLEAATKLLSGDVQVVELDGNVKAMVGEKTIAEYIKSWSESDVGKNFILAPGSSGGGANNKGNGAGGGDGDFAKYFDRSSGEFNMTKQMELSKSDPDEYKRLAEKFAGSSIQQPSAMRTF